MVRGRRTGPSLRDSITSISISPRETFEKGCVKCSFPEREELGCIQGHGRIGCTGTGEVLWLQGRQRLLPSAPSAVSVQCQRAVSTAGNGLLGGGWRDSCPRDGRAHAPCHSVGTCNCVVYESLLQEGRLGKRMGPRPLTLPGRHSSVSPFLGPSPLPTVHFPLTHPYTQSIPGLVDSFPDGSWSLPGPY